MTALEIIEELQGMGIEIYAYAGGHQPFGGRTKLRDIGELRGRLEQARKLKYQREILH